MFFAQAPDGPLSIRFRIGPFPVSIGPSFWVMAILPMLRADLVSVAIWVACVLVSLLVHELGHAVACWGFELPARIRLYAFGGLTFHAPTGRRGQILIALAGPFAGFSLGVLAYLVTPFLPVGWPRAAQLCALLIQISFVWGMVNLLPVPPLDGGHVLEQLLGPGRRRTARLVATITGAAACAAGIALGQPWLATFFLVFALLHGAAWLGARRRSHRQIRASRAGVTGPPFSAPEAPRGALSPPPLPISMPGSTLPGIEAQEALESAEAAYQEAKRLARGGDARAAALSLNRALRLGYEDLDALNGDPDLEQVRREPEIAAILNPLGLWSPRSPGKRT